MRLFVLEANQNHPVFSNPYDKYFGFVVRAESEKEARQIAAGEAADEGRDTWFNCNATKCREVPLQGEKGIILSDFSAG